jgi:hypothetical protein
MHHELTPIETRLAALALDAACVNGELEAAAVKFFEALKRRGVRIEEFASDWLAPDWLVIRSLHAPTNMYELRALAKRLGCCPCCGNKTL